MENIDKVIKGCKRKTRSSQKELFEYLNGHLYKTCLIYSSGEKTALKALEESLSRVFQSISKFNGDDVKKWANSIAVEFLIESLKSEYIKRDSVLTEKLPTEGLLNLDDECGDDCDPEDLIIALQLLKPTNRFAFNLSVFEEYSAEKIIKLLNLSSREDYENILHNSRVKLKKSLN